MTPGDRINLGLRDVSAACACCATSPELGEEVSASAEVTSEALITGMTCSHCVSSVSEELMALDGVEQVSVDLNIGGASRVTIRSSAPVEETVVRAAVGEAGYSLVSVSS